MRKIVKAKDSGIIEPVKIKKILKKYGMKFCKTIPTKKQIKNLEMETKVAKSALKEGRTYCHQYCNGENFGDVYSPKKERT